ncbi:MAG: hypothetical protein ACI9RO_000694 [Alteromonas macleodii]|jgi:hypothetical protein
MIFTLNPLHTWVLRNHNTEKALPFTTALTVWAQRRALANLDSTRLKDLGISPQDATIEAGRPFWDLPKRLLH